MEPNKIGEMVKVDLGRSYTGNIRRYRFVDGVSIDEIPIKFALVLGASGGAKTTDGRILNPSRWWKNSNLGRHTVKPVSPRPKKEEAVTVEEKVEQFEDAPTVYTEEELGKVADKRGIGGLREIGDQLGVKSNSIVGLMKAILEKTAPLQASDKGPKDKS